MANERNFGLNTLDGRRPRVAVVCANIANATVAIMLCEQFGCAPHAAATGEAALALLRREAFDLVLLDLAMPDMDAVAAAQLIRALGARGSMPIVALGDKAADIASGRTRAAGFSGTITKPYSPRELYAAMQSALGRAAVTTASVS